MQLRAKKRQRIVFQGELLASGFGAHQHMQHMSAVATHRACNKLDRVQEFKIEKMRAVMVVKWYLLKAKLRTGSNNH